MELQKIAVKIFTETPDRVPLSDFIDVFHGWIQATDGIYHDVADYSHMHAGPGIVLVANSANVGIDETGNRRGLLLTQKAHVNGSNAQTLKETLRSALENCRKLENDPKLKGELKFSGNEIAFAVNDRLAAPQEEAAFSELKREVESLAQKIFAGAGFTVKRAADPRQRLNITVKANKNFDTAALLGNLQFA